MIHSTYPFELPPLPYGYADLEPFIDTETVDIHYNKHFGGYVDKLNIALKPYVELHSLTLVQLLTSPQIIPQQIQADVMHNGGGVYNHYYYFNGLSPLEEKRQPSASFTAEISANFGSFAEFKNQFNAAAAALFGSGYTFLVKKDGILKILNAADQDTPLLYGCMPILTLDVWEHAYYLKYKNLRGEYIENMWNIINIADI